MVQVEKDVFSKFKKQKPLLFYFTLHRKIQPQDCVQHQISSSVVLPCAQHVTHPLRTLTDKVDSHSQREYITPRN